MTIKTKTEMHTEYAGMGLKPDGTWKKITPSQIAKTDAIFLLDEYIADAEKHPDLFTNYEKYMVMNRTVITTIEDWRE